MSSPIECPICMDDIQLTLNCITTECGHCFHASCIMRNVAQNGFGCPYCRNVMAEKVEDEEEEEEDEEADWEAEEEDYLLRGFRFFYENIHGIEHHSDDLNEEEEQMEQMEEEEVEEVIIKPTPKYISEKLMQQGISMEKLVKIILYQQSHNEYSREDEEYGHLDDNIFGKIRVLISNYQPPNEVVVPLLPIPEPVLVNLDNSAQPKINQNITLRRRNVINNEL